MDDVIVLGVVTRPMLGLRWWAQAGRGAYQAPDRDGDLGEARRLQTASGRDLAAARVTGWPEYEPTGMVQRLQSHGLWSTADMTVLPKLLDGELDVILALRAGPWDFAPGVILVEEAGGEFCDIHGGRSIYLGGALFTSGPIHGQTRNALGIAQP